MPRSVAVALVLLAAGPAAAQPPAGGPPQLVVARVQDGKLVYGVTELVTTTREEEVTILVDGRPVKQKRTVLVRVPVNKEVSVPLADLRAADGSGRAIPHGRLADRLGRGAGVLIHAGPLPPALRRMFRDDAVLIDTDPQDEAGTPRP